MKHEQHIRRFLEITYDDDGLERPSSSSSSWSIERNRFLGGVYGCSVSLECGYLRGDVEYLVAGIFEGIM